MANFQRAYILTCKNEGGYTNDPKDAGGETYRGVSRRFYPDWGGWKTIDKYKNHTDFLTRLDKDEDLHKKVKKLFKNFYWNKFWGDKIPDQEIADELFDTSINLGVSRAIKYLQKALNALNRNQKSYADIIEDGIFGNSTLNAINQYLKKDTNMYILQIMNILQGVHYLNYMKKSPTQEKYARGWLNRVVLSKFY